MARMFDRYRPHDRVRIIDVDHVGTRMKVESEWSGLVDTVTFHALANVVHSSLLPGRSFEIQVQDVSARQAHDSRWRMKQGERRVTSMRHMAPTVSRLALRTLQWLLPPGELAVHLCDFRDHASTLKDQFEIVIAGRNVEVMTRFGRLSLGLMLNPGGRTDAVTHYGVSLEQEIPDSVARAMTGQPLGRLVGHPALGDDALVVERVETSLGTKVTLERDDIGINEAIAMVAGTITLPLAA